MTTRDIIEAGLFLLGFGLLVWGFLGADGWAWRCFAWAVGIGG